MSEIKDKKLLVDDQPDIPVDHDFEKDKTFTGIYTGESTGEAFLFEDVNGIQHAIPNFPAVIEAMESQDVVKGVSMTFTHKGIRNSDGREMFTITIN